MSFAIFVSIAAIIVDFHPVSAYTSDPFCRDTVEGTQISCDVGYTCRVGRKPYKQIEFFTDEMVDTLPMFEDDTTIHGQYCDCLEDFVSADHEGMTGIMCHTMFRRCRNDLICFHGAPCRMLLDDDNFFDCDCSEINDGVFTFDGDHCENKAGISRVCPVPAGYDQKDFYCENGGICPDNPWEHCQCPEDYTGPRCEFLSALTLNAQKEKKECDLECVNGGYCFFGDSPTSRYDDLGINQKERSISNMHCKCPAGLIGLRCETDVRICGLDFNHYCLNDGVCVNNGDDYTCKCVHDALSPYAGDNCQHQATSMCKGFHNSFCTNNGKCKEVSEGTEDASEYSPELNRHPGCVCSDGFHGEYCEHGEKKTAEKLIWIYLSILAFILIVISTLLSIKHLGYKKESKYSGMDVDADVDEVPGSERMHNVEIS